MAQIEKNGGGGAQRHDAATGFKCKLTVPQHFGNLATSVLLSLFDCLKQFAYKCAILLVRHGSEQ